jgi:hypothetical protein
MITTVSAYLDDVDPYCPDRELILNLYEEADRFMHR